MGTTTTGSYINGSDLLLKVGDKAIGHCTTHTLSFKSESKDHAVKPAASAASGTSFWKEKTVTGLSISVSAEGLEYTGESENGFTALSALWGAGAAVEVFAFARGSDSSPYLKGKFIITSVEETSPAQDDTTYKIELENAGTPDIYPGKPTAAA